MNKINIKTLIKCFLNLPKAFFPTSNKIKLKEKDIIERADWLCKNVVINPYDLLNKMPNELGEHFQGEWAIYTCTHLSAALLNICNIYPQYKYKYVPVLKKLVEIVKHPIIRKYDTASWNEDALEALDKDSSHITYLSLLSWTICNYRELSNDRTYDKLLLSCCDSLNRKVLANHLLPSYPDGIIYIPDMMFVIVALHKCSKMFNGIYDNTVNDWISYITNNMIDPNTKLIKSVANSDIIRGSYSALNCYCLTLLDDYELANNQYTRFKKVFKKSKIITGIKEFIKDGEPMLYFDVDAGPILFGLSPSGTAWAIGSATYFKDYKFRNKLLKTADIVGDTVHNGGTHYKLGELFLVGESVTLAMKTNISSK